MNLQTTFAVFIFIRRKTVNVDRLNKFLIALGLFISSMVFSGSLLYLRLSATQMPQPSASIPYSMEIAVPVRELASTEEPDDIFFFTPEDPFSEPKVAFSPSSEFAPPESKPLSATPSPQTKQPRQVSPPREDAVEWEDLASYRVTAKRASKNDYLPTDESLKVSDLENRFNGKKVDEDWAGDGFAGNVLRSATHVVQTIDGATLDASQNALKNVASPDRATVRPSSNQGVRLHIDIPTDSLKLKKK